jgi:hypothetical protein
MLLGARAKKLNKRRIKKVIDTLGDSAIMVLLTIVAVTHAVRHLLLTQSKKKQ